MLTKGMIFLSLVILIGIAAIATLRLTRYSDAANKFSSDSNEQLQSSALDLVKKLRGLVDSYNKQDLELIADYQTNYWANRIPAVSTFDSISNVVVPYIRKMHLESVPGMNYLLLKAYAIASWLAPTTRDPIREQFEKDLRGAHDSAIHDYKEKLLEESKTI